MESATGAPYTKLLAHCFLPMCLVYCIIFVHCFFIVECFVMAPMSWYIVHDQKVREYGNLKKKVIPKCTLSFLKK